jgi:ATP-dependent DNA helicase RecG
VENVHFPATGGPRRLQRFRSPSHRRIVFDELFFFQLAMALKNRGTRRCRGIPFRTGGPLAARFRRMLPFPLTADQEKAAGEIEADMARPWPMNRLLQGDVGCGKTVVSMTAMVTACENGFQAAIMAPTESWEQHHRRIREWAEELGLKTGLLTGAGGERNGTASSKRSETGASTWSWGPTP